jgi:signal peptidase II
MISLKKIALIAFLVVVDQLSKYIIRFSGGFYICNGKLAFGLSPFNFFMLFLGIVFIFLALNYKSFFNQKFEIQNLKAAVSLPIIFVISGALSNIIDRFCFGCVLDFIDIKFWPVFNLADVYISLGVMMIAFNILRNKKSASKE